MTLPLLAKTMRRLSGHSVATFALGALGALAMGACAAPGVEEQEQEQEEGEQTETSESAYTDPNDPRGPHQLPGYRQWGTPGTTSSGGSTTTTTPGRREYDKDDVNRTGGTDGETNASLSPVRNEPNLFEKLASMAKHRDINMRFDVMGPWQKMAAGRPVPGLTGQAIPSLNSQMPLNWGRDPGAGSGGGNGGLAVTRSAMRTLEPLMGDSVHPMVSMGAEPSAPLHELRVIGTPTHLIVHGFKNSFKIRTRIGTSLPAKFTAWHDGMRDGRGRLGWTCRGDACLQKQALPTAYTGWFQEEFTDVGRGAGQRIVTINYRVSKGRYTSVQFAGARRATGTSAF